MELSSPWKDFHGIWNFRIIQKSVEKIQVPLKFDKNNRHFYTKIYVHLYLYEFSLEWEMFQAKVGAITRDILCSITFFPRKLCSLWDNAGKYGTARRGTGDNLMRRRKYMICVPDN